MRAEMHAALVTLLRARAQPRAAFEAECAVQSPGRFGRRQIGTTGVHGARSTVAMTPRTETWGLARSLIVPAQLTSRCCCGADQSPGIDVRKSYAGAEGLSMLWRACTMVSV